MIERYPIEHVTLPIAQATGFGDLVFVAGHVGFKPGTIEPISDDIREQTVETLRLIDEALARAGSDRQHLLMMRVYLTHPTEDFDAMNEVFAQWIGEHIPARTTVGAQLARPGLLVEIDAIAVRCSVTGSGSGRTRAASPKGPRDPTDPACADPPP